MNKAKFCPNCESFNVEASTSFLSILGGNFSWVCNDCGFRAPVFPDEDDKIKKEVLNLKKHKI